MAKQKLVDYIKKTREKGFDDDKIRQALEGQGWYNSDIDEAFESLKDRLPEAPAPDEETGISPKLVDPDDSGKPEPAAEKPRSERYNVLAILSFVFTFIISIVGFIMAIIALVQIKKTGEKGKGFAIAAIVINCILIGVILLTFMIAPLAYFGVLDPAQMLPERCSGLAGMDCIDKAVVTEEGVMFALRNNIGFRITILDVEGQVCNGAAGVAEGITGEIATNEPFEPVTVENNEVYRIRVDCSLRQGQEFDDEFTVQYRNNATGLTHDATVEIRSQVT